MPAYYRTKVQEIDRLTGFIKIHLKVINQDANELSSRAVRNFGFILGLLDNFKLKDTPLRAYIDEDNMYKASWLQKYAKGYIKEFKVRDIWMPIDDEVMKTYHETPELWEEANVEITCTDPAWIQHLNEGDSWESYAYVITMEFDSCEPIQFEA